MEGLKERSKKDSGFTLVEVIIAIFILSMVAAAALSAFVYSMRISRDRQYEMNALNLANDRIEYIRSLEFSSVGTKFVNGATTIYGDPEGEILQSETKTLDGINYLINTTISWEDESGWELSSTDWDYKSVRVETIPQIIGREVELTKVVNTYVTRDSSQPILSGANIALRAVRGWKEHPTDIVTVPNVKVSMLSGPDAPRQTKTSTSGIARFINLDPGAYSIQLDPSTAGMMLNPDVSSSWAANPVAGNTQALQFEVEKPCYLNLYLKSLEGDPILLNAGDTGNIQVDAPYGTDINQNFGASDISAQGCLSQSLFGALWPVGDGYSGAYTVTGITVAESTYFGAYVINGATEIPWTGTFDSPGTVKNIICYFGVFPKTPSGIGSNWVDGTGAIKTAADPFYAGNAIFATSDHEDTITMQTGITSDFNAENLFFENTGSMVNIGLLIQNYANLRLHAGKVVFRGSVEIESNVATEQGKIVLSNSFSDGSVAHQIPGTSIGGLADPGRLYGKVYFMDPLKVNGSEAVSPGAYYFYDGLVLPDNASELIPITKDNYVG